MIRRGYVTCAGAMVIVGASVAVSASLADFPLYGGQAVRYAVAALILLGLIRQRRVPWLLPDRRETARLVALAAVGLVAFNVCIIEGSKHTGPSLIGAAVGATPVVLALTAAARRGGGVGRRTVVAAFVVAAGVALVEGVGSVDLDGLGFAFGALACEVGFSLIAVPLLPRLGALRVSAYACCAAVPLLVAVGVVTSGPLIAVPDVRELAALTYLAIFVTAVAFVLWYSGLRTIGPARAGLFAGLLPVAALASSVVLGFEHLTLHALVGCVAVASGLLIGMWPTRVRASVVADPTSGESIAGRVGVGDRAQGHRDE